MAVPGDVMGDVGDMHAQAPPARRRALDRYRIVEVARVDGVDGEQEPVADIAAQRVGERAVDVEAAGARLVDRRPGIAVLEVVAGHDAGDAEVRRVRAAEPALDGRDPRLVARRVAHDARRHHVARRDPVVGGGGVARQDEEVLAAAAVERAHHAQGARHVVGAHERDAAPVEDALDHRAHLPARPAVQAHRDRVAGHGLADAPLGEAELALGGADEGPGVREPHGAGEPRPALPGLPAAACAAPLLAPHGASLPEPSAPRPPARRRMPRRGVPGRSLHRPPPARVAPARPRLRARRTLVSVYVYPGGAVAIGPAWRDTGRIARSRGDARVKKRAAPRTALIAPGSDPGRHRACAPTP